MTSRLVIMKCAGNISRQLFVCLPMTLRCTMQTIESIYNTHTAWYIFIILRVLWELEQIIEYTLS